MRIIESRVQSTSLPIESWRTVGMCGGVCADTPNGCAIDVYAAAALWFICVKSDKYCDSVGSVSCRAPEFFVRSHYLGVSVHLKSVGMRVRLVASTGRRVDVAHHGGPVARRQNRRSQRLLKLLLLLAVLCASILEPDLQDSKNALKCKATGKTLRVKFASPVRLVRNPCRVQMEGTRRETHAEGLPNKVKSPPAERI